MERRQIYTFCTFDFLRFSEPQDIIDQINEFPFEAGAGIKKFLGKFPQEKGSVAQSPEEADFVADYVE
jgi:hypothetical protein